MNKTLVWIINAAVIYALVVGVMLLSRRSLLYPFDERAAWTGDLPRVSIESVSRPDGSKLVVWAAEPAPKKPVVFYFMGNAGNLEYFRDRFRLFLEHGYGLIAMSYRGGGGTDGLPSELALKSDAKFLWDNVEGALRIRSPEYQRIIYGYSLGSGIAVDLATQTNPAALVLEAPFTRLCDVVTNRLKIIPACRLMWDEFYPIIDELPQTDVPFLILHGSEDKEIPVEMGEAVFKSAPEKGTLKVYPGGSHNDLRLHGADRDAIAFIDAVLAQNNSK